MIPSNPIMILFETNVAELLMIPDFDIIRKHSNLIIDDITIQL